MGRDMESELQDEADYKVAWITKQITVGLAVVVTSEDRMAVLKGATSLEKLRADSLGLFLLDNGQWRDINTSGICTWGLG